MATPKTTKTAAKAAEAETKAETKAAEAGTKAAEGNEAAKTTKRGRPAGRIREFENPQPNDLLTIAEAAHFTRLTEGQIRSAVTRGAIPAVQVLGAGPRLIRRSDLDPASVLVPVAPRTPSDEPTGAAEHVSGTDEPGPNEHDPMLD